MISEMEMDISTLICKLKPCKDASGENKIQFCAKHLQIYKEYLENNPCLVSEKKSQLLGIEYPNLITNKEKEIDLPPDDLRCSHDGVRRCKRVRMWVDAEDDTIVPNTKYCRHHYTYYAGRSAEKKKKTSGDGASGPNCSYKRRKKKVLIETGIQLPATTTSDKSHYDKIKGSANTGTKRKNVERTECSGELESLTRTRDPMVQLDSLEHYKSECVKLALELEKKKAECTELQGKLVEVDSRLATVKDETERTLADATECWRKMFSDLESRVVLNMENGNSTMGCVESRISKLESLVLRSAEESSIRRCVELQNSENTEACDLLNDVTQTGDKQRDKNSRIKLTSLVYESKTKENVPNVSDIGINKHHAAELEIPKYSATNNSSGSLHLSSGAENVEEWKGRGCSEERPSQHHLEMPFVNLVSDDDGEKPIVNLVSDDDGESSRESFPEDSDSSSDSKGSLGDLMDMMAMKYTNSNKDKEIRWKFEADMLSSFEEDPELCMKAVCALYRQQISEDEVSAKGLFHYNDVLRVTTLAKFLMDEDCKGDLKKSVEELENFDSEAVEDCKMLAKRYSKQLFSAYQNGEDPSYFNCQPRRSNRCCLYLVSLVVPLLLQQVRESGRLRGLYAAVSMLNQEKVQDTIINQLSVYRSAGGLMGEPLAKRNRMATSPDEWWINWGSEVQRFAKKVLGLECF